MDSEMTGKINWLKCVLAVAVIAGLSLAYLIISMRGDLSLPAALLSLCAATIPSLLAVLLAFVCVYFVFYRRGLIETHPQGATSDERLCRAARQIEEIRNGLAAIEETLREEDFRPDIILAFSRSSAVVAGMLAVHLKVPEVLVLNRRKKSGKSSEEGIAREFETGYCLALKPECFLNRKILIACYSIETGSTLDAGLSYLEAQGIKSTWKIVTLYITQAARFRYPHAHFVQETARNPLNDVPWITGAYHRI